MDPLAIAGIVSCGAWLASLALMRMVESLRKDRKNESIHVGELERRRGEIMAMLACDHAGNPAAANYCRRCGRQLRPIPGVVVYSGTNVAGIACGASRGQGDGVYATRDFATLTLCEPLRSDNG